MPFQLPVPWLFKSRPSFTFSRRVNHGHTTRSTKLHAIMARSGHRPLASLGPRTSPNTANPRSAANRGYGSYRCGFQPDESSSLLISRVIEKSNIWLIGGILFEETLPIRLSREPHPLYVVCLLGLQARAGAGALRRRSG